MGSTLRDAEALELARSLLSKVLPAEDISRWRRNTALLGAVPAFDSMTMVALITLAEEQFGVIVDDADLSADDFVTLESVARWLQRLAA